METDLTLGGGRTLHVYDTGLDDADGRLAVFWHHGTPNIGAPPEPLFPAADRLGIRWVSYDRPGYGGSSPHRDRDVASAADYVSCVADALDIDRFAVVGQSGGSPHALACGALLPERVLGVVSVAGMAPFGAEGLDWYTGGGLWRGGAARRRRRTHGEGELRGVGRRVRPGDVHPKDHAALSGAWSWLLEVVKPAVEAGPGGLIDDDLAYVASWGFDPARVVAPILLLHGGKDRVVPSSHGEWLAHRCPSAQLWLSPDEGHISVLHCGAASMEWLRNTPKKSEPA
jgi:pimeloyl-ACP methyl ester carboxylesterase